MSEVRGDGDIENGGEREIRNRRWGFEMSSEILDIRFDVVDGNNPVEGRDQEGGISI